MKPTVSDLLKLIGNPGVYAIQNAYDGSWSPVREPLTREVLRKHRAGKITVGTYVVKPPDQARTLVLDIDAKTPAEQDKMLNRVCSMLASLRISDAGQGLDWGVENSGQKGYHVWVVAEDYVDASTLYRLGRGVREEAGYPTLEVFPKQVQVRDLGNLLKLPGGVHAVTGTENNFVGSLPKATPVHVLYELAERYPEVGLRKQNASATDALEYPCIHAIQGGVEEGGRNTALFHLSTMLRRWSLLDEHVDAIVRSANAASTPPLDDQEVTNLLSSSQYSGPVCGQLSDDLHCGDQCMLTRHDGLYTRKGMLKWAAVGDVVTLEVESRTEEGNVLELAHPDATQVRAVLIETRRK